MNWYKKAQESSIKLYHITNLFSARKIIEVGFDPSILNPGNSFHFTTRNGIKKWAEKLQNERRKDFKDKSLYMGISPEYSKEFPLESDVWKNIKIIEVTIDQSLYNKLHRLGDDIFYKGHTEKYNYDQGKYIKTNIIPLKDGVNCNIRILEDKEINELV